MKHIAERLLPYVGKNKVIHADNIEHPALKRLIYSERAIPKIRKALKDFDPQIEVLIPRRVDDEEQQLKRYIQYRMGVEVNLSKLREKHRKLYYRLYDYGSPEEVIRKWGLIPCYDGKLTESQIKEELKEMSNNHIVEGVFRRNEKLYDAILYHARKKGMTVKEYIESMGFIYKGRNKSENKQS